MENNQKSIVAIAVFGTLWGFVEATLGNALHLLHLPFSGSILASIALMIILIARIYNPTRGSTFLMAVIAAFIKAISFSTVKLGPFVAIIAEGILIELILLLFRPGRFGFLASGLVMALYPIIQTVVTKTILFGSSFVPVILELAEGFSERIGYQAGWWLLGFYLFAQILLPLSAAYLAWILKKRLSPQLAER
jgi:ABC-type thiamin/hydroxymethylpyrimidine transport system permease subunit